MPVEVLGFGSHEVGSGKASGWKVFVVLAPPAEGRDAIRHAVRHQGGPLHLLHEVLGAASGTLERMEKLFAREPRAHLHRELIAASGEVDVELLAAADGFRLPLLLVFPSLWTLRSPLSA